MTDEGKQPGPSRAEREPEAPLDWAALRSRTASVADRLSERLERLIDLGTLAPGSRLPGEREFATELGVSRASVREALSELELKGLVDRRPGRGTVIADTGDRPPSMLARWPREERRLREVMDLRMTLEPAIAARAAGRATERDLGRLSDLLERMGPDVDPDAFHELDVEFHRQIARATHNELLVELIETAVELMAPSRSLELRSPGRQRASVEAHRRILDAIVARNAEKAAAAMTRHLDAVERLVGEASRLR